MTAATAAGLPTHRPGKTPLDHGAVVPLWFLAEAGWAGATMVCGLPIDESSVVRMGEILREVLTSAGGRVAVIASGDMSHRLTESAPCGFHPSGKTFDEAFMQLLREGNIARLREIDAEVRDAAAEDAAQSTVVALAASGNDATGHRVLSYEGPFGVGYGVAVLHQPIAPRNGGPSVPHVATEKAVCQPMPPSPLGLADLPRFARQAVEAHFRREKISWPSTAGTPLAQPLPVFVTIHDRDGELRGCVGALAAQERDLILETQHYALAAALHDHRFQVVRAEEMPRLHFCVTVLHPDEPVNSVAELDPAIYGVIMSTTDGRRSVLLPAIEGVDTVAEQLRILRRKGGIGDDERVQLRRFRADAYEETKP